MTMMKMTKSVTEVLQSNLTDDAISGTTNVRTETADGEMIFEGNALDELQLSLPNEIGGGEVYLGAEKSK